MPVRLGAQVPGPFPHDCVVERGNLTKLPADPLFLPHEKLPALKRNCSSSCATRGRSATDFTSMGLTHLRTPSEQTSNGERKRLCSKALMVAWPSPVPPDSRGSARLPFLAVCPAGSRLPSRPRGRGKPVRPPTSIYCRALVFASATPPHFLASAARSRHSPPASITPNPTAQPHWRFLAPPTTMLSRFRKPTLAQIAPARRIRPRPRTPLCNASKRSWTVD